MFAAAPAVLVKAKFAFVATLLTDAATLYEPAVVFAVKAVAVATPLALVFTLTVLTPPANVPLAPLAGAVNVTEAPETGLPPLSFTVACRAVANAALTVALCGVPAVAVMVAGTPAAPVVKARWKLVVPPSPRNDETMKK